MRLDSITQLPAWELKVRNTMDNMSHSESCVAQTILRSPDAVLGTSIHQLAVDSGVSEASVLRFFQKAGFSGLKEFKSAVVQDRVSATNKRFANRALNDTDSTHNFKTKIFWGCIDALVDTVSILDDAQLSCAVDMLAAAPYIEVFGIGGSASVARSALHSFRSIGVRMNITTDFNFDYLRMERFRPGDVVLVISRSGETAEILEAVRIVKEKGAYIISITNAHQSSLSKLSNCCLTSTSRTYMLPDDETYERVAQIAIIHALYAGVAIRLNGERNCSGSEM